jgi:hypothetical protein
VNAPRYELGTKVFIDEKTGNSQTRPLRQPGLTKIHPDHGLETGLSVVVRRVGWAIAQFIAQACTTPVLQV